jgi:hypothetical protein
VVQDYYAAGGRRLTMTRGSDHLADYEGTMHATYWVADWPPRKPPSAPAIEVDGMVYELGVTSNYIHLTGQPRSLRRGDRVA